ncbi:hypothetical protein BCR32DRAFT_326387 [Anaeromyces robustus]|uniref:SF3 helicase domain-containing protein n=1 Tax=Anaeromyces robustus TaxID=1754192 RepID=A0A1Y1XCG9_9FUNG|nr:hypothetical protein BCR32DRAFT_326387 [Anaeromyces robustus]|eukprot:ORX83415.1 hypothetical protein BCR32DRAFT_326387 [Anaeromyces robustus]
MVNQSKIKTEIKKEILDEGLENNYNEKIHPLLNFFYMLYISSTEEDKNTDTYHILGQFLLEKGIHKGISRKTCVPSVHYNDLVFLCFNTYNPSLIEQIKLIIIKHYLASFGKKINDNIICLIFTLFNLGYIVYDNNWYYFSQSFHGWKIITDMEILQDINVYLVCNILKTCNVYNYSIDLTKVSEYLNVGKINFRAVEHMKSILFYDDFKKKLDKKPILRFTDCIYDFEFKTTRPGKPSDFCSKGVGYSFYEVENSDNSVQKVKQFLKDIFVKDELIEYILKVLASTLTPCNKLRSLLFFIGNGRNGKTALSNILKFTLGEYAVIPNVSLFLGKSVTSDKPNPHMVELNNAHVAICEEPDAKNVAITGDSKAITGNVGYIKARNLYQDLEDIFVDLLPIINTNDKLTIMNIDTALMDRIIVIPFTQRFIPKHKIGKKDENEKYADVLWQGNNSKIFAPGFMKLLLEHYQDDYTKLSIPKIVYDATYEFILRGDHPGRFIKQRLCYTNNDNDIIKLEDVYTIYKKWYKNYVNGGSFHYTTEDLRLDFAKYKIYFEQNTPANNLGREIDILKGYKFY